jgi:hypothetical protein
MHVNDLTVLGTKRHPEGPLIDAVLTAPGCGQIPMLCSLGCGNGLIQVKRIRSASDLFEKA